MCSFGIAGRGVIAALCGNDPSGLTALSCRFSGPVYPGETLRTEIWCDGAAVRFRTLVPTRAAEVLSQGFATLKI